jgi:hypothetical protein
MMNSLLIIGYTTPPLETNPCISFLIASISTLQTNAVQFLRIPPAVSADLPDRLFSVWPDWEEFGCR